MNQIIFQLIDSCHLRMSRLKVIQIVKKGLSLVGFQFIADGHLQSVDGTYMQGIPVQEGA